MNTQIIVTNTKRYWQKEQQPFCSWNDWRSYMNIGRVSKGEIFRIHPDRPLCPPSLLYLGADKSLAQSGRKQATATKLELLQATQKQFKRLPVQSGLRGNNDLRVGRKMTTFQLFFQLGRAKDLSAPLYSRFRVVPRGKEGGAWRWPPTTSSDEFKERAELYLYAPSGPLWSVLGWTLHLPLLT